ncbi:MAG: hypothetical protein Hals2KO_13030 [Halioglobus sp.]
MPFKGDDIQTEKILYLQCSNNYTDSSRKTYNHGIRHNLNHATKASQAEEDKDNSSHETADE